MDFRLVLALLLVFASVDVLGRKRGRRNRRRFPRRFPKPYPWMHYSSNYDPTVEENGCVDIRPNCPKWASFPGYCGYAKGYMQRHCRKSCRLCRVEDEATIGKTSGYGNSFNEICEDRLEDCQTYIKSQSQCDLFSGLMTKYCRKTCGFCCFDILSDCTLFIKKSSQCRGLNGFFRRYCANTCQMCGLLLPTKKPGCQDELDDCSSFSPEQCLKHKSFCSKYCAKTCGFCEDKGHSPPAGTIQPVIYQQRTDGPTNNETTQDSSPSTPQRVTERIYQDAVITPQASEGTHQRDTPPPDGGATSPTDSGISPATTEIPHKEATLENSKKDESATTGSKTETITTSEEEPAGTAAPSTTTNSSTGHIITTMVSERYQVQIAKPTKTTSSLEVKTEFSEPSDVSEEYTTRGTSFPTKSTETRTREITESTFSTAQVPENTSIIEEPKSSSSGKISEVPGSAKDSVETSTPAAKTKTGLPITSEGSVSESPSGATQASSRVQSSSSEPKTTSQPEATTIERASTVKVEPTQQEADETTPSSVLDRIPTTVSTARSATGDLSIDDSTPRPRSTTDIPIASRPDSHASSLSTANPVTNIPSPSPSEVPAVDTGNPDVTETAASEDPILIGTPLTDDSTVSPKTDIEVTTTGKATEEPSRTKQSTVEHSPTASTNESPRTKIPITATENLDVEVDGLGKGNPTAEAPAKKEQNIDTGVGTTGNPTTIRSHLRSKTGKKTVCVDRLTECASYVKENINYCKYHVHFMHEFCSKSCDFCVQENAAPPTRSTGRDKASIPKCEDKSNKCQYFSRFVGYCTVNRKYMKRRCPKSCGFCGKGCCCTW